MPQLSEGSMTTKLVILDRDGVINESLQSSVTSPQDWRALPGSLEAIAELTRKNYRVVIATNQSGIRRKLLDVETLNRIHQRLHHEVAQVGGLIEAVFFCPCHPKDNCECYQPNPGMLLDIASRLKIDLGQVPVVGDSLSCLQCAQAAGARPFLVLTGNGEGTAISTELPENTEIFSNLRAAVKEITNG